MSELPKEMIDHELQRNADVICDELDKIFFEIVGGELDRVRNYGRSALVTVVNLAK